MLASSVASEVTFLTKCLNPFADSIVILSNIVPTLDCLLESLA